MIRIGEYSLWLALAAAVWALAASVRDAIRQASDGRDAERALWVCGLGLTVATGTLAAALIVGTLSLQYVAALTAWNVPVPYRIAALWAAPPGTILLAALVLSGLAPLVLRATRARARDAKSWVVIVISLALVLLIVPLLTNPGLFAALDFVPAQGLGMDPRLQVPEMLAYSPALVAGLAASVVAAAIAVAGIASRRLDGAWLALCRQWTAISWGLLTVALFVSLEWSYSANAGAEWRGEPWRSGLLVAWVIASITLGVLVTQERRGVAAAWVAPLMFASAMSTALPALVTRHIAGPSASVFLASPIGNWSLIFSVVFIAYIGYLAADVRAARFEARAAGRKFPIALSVAGLTLVIAGLVAANNTTRVDVTIADGASAKVRDAFNYEWIFASSGTSVFKFANRFTTATALVPSQGSARRKLMRTETREFVGGDEQPYGEPMLVPGVSHALLEDAVVILRAAPSGRAMLTIVFVPLASFTWTGGAILLFGVLLTTRGTTSMAEREAEDPAEAAVRRWRTRTVECPDCGPRPESVAMFCSNCGRFLESECPRCHIAVHAKDARYCENCGVGFGG